MVENIVSEASSVDRGCKLATEGETVPGRGWSEDSSATAVGAACNAARDVGLVTELRGCRLDAGLAAAAAWLNGARLSAAGAEVGVAALRGCREATLVRGCRASVGARDAGVAAISVAALGVREEASVGAAGKGANGLRGEAEDGAAERGGGGSLATVGTAGRGARGCRDAIVGSAGGAAGAGGVPPC